MYVFMYVRLCVFFVLLGIELKLGMGVGDGPPRFVGIFSKRPNPKVIGHAEVKLV